MHLGSSYSCSRKTAVNSKTVTRISKWEKTQITGCAWRGRGFVRMFIVRILFFPKTAISVHAGPLHARIHDHFFIHILGIKFQWNANMLISRSYTQSLLNCFWASFLGSFIEIYLHYMACMNLGRHGCKLQLNLLAEAFKHEAVILVYFIDNNIKMGFNETLSVELEIVCLHFINLFSFSLLVLKKCQSPLCPGLRHGQPKDTVGSKTRLSKCGPETGLEPKQIITVFL